MRRALLAAPAAVLLAVLPIAGGAAPEPFSVAIVRPAPGVAVFGDFEVEVAVRPAGAAVRALEIYLDGVRAALLEAPPWRAVLQTGQQNEEHRIEVVARDAAGRTATAGLTTAKIRTDMEVLVELRQLYVRVEREGRPVLDLDRGDFTVLGRRHRAADHGLRARRRAVQSPPCWSTPAPACAASGWPPRSKGARTFAAGMQRLDEAKLLLFSDRLLLETPFTNLAPILALPLERTTADGGSAVYDTLYLALKRLEARPGRRVLVLLSDGVDVESALPIERVQWAARRSQAVLYWLRLHRPEDDVAPDQVHRLSAWRDAAGHRRGPELLEQTVIESGGRVEVLAQVEEVGPALERLLAELRDQYLHRLSAGRAAAPAPAAGATCASRCGTRRSPGSACARRAAISSPDAPSFSDLVCALLYSGRGAM